MKNKTAKDAMLSIDKAYMVNIHARLDNEVMTQVSLDCSLSILPAKSTK